MTRDELRQMVIAGDDQLHNMLGGVIWMHLSPKQQASVLHSRNLLAAPTVEEAPIVNAFLDACVARINDDDYGRSISDVSSL